MFLEIALLYLLHSSSHPLPALKKITPPFPNTPYPPRLTNPNSFVYKGMSSRIKGTKIPALPLQISVILSFLCSCLANPDRRGSFILFQSVFTPNFLSQTVFISSFTCMRMEMVVAVQPHGASQEPRESQHRQCLQRRGPAPGHGTQTWILITGSIHCPKPGKVNESSPRDMQEGQENKVTRDKA